MYRKMIVLILTGLLSTVSAIGQVRVELEQESQDTVSVVEEEWVDLGLPSGTKWLNKNTGLYETFEDAVALGAPTKAQWKELRDECKWYYSKGVFTVKGPNGKTIDLPAEGFVDCDGAEKGGEKNGYYWSSSPRGEDEAFYTLMSSNMTYVGGFMSTCSNLFVRPVLKP